MAKIFLLYLYREVKDRLSLYPAPKLSHHLQLKFSVHRDCVLISYYYNWYEEIHQDQDTQSNKKYSDNCVISFFFFISIYFWYKDSNGWLALNLS